MNSCVSSLRIVALATSLLSIASPAFAVPTTVTLAGSGTNSLGHTVAAEAVFSLDNPDTLVLQLTNTSPGPSLDPVDVLSSFYFDVTNGTSRPTLTYADAFGAVYQTSKNFPDTNVHYTPPMSPSSVTPPPPTLSNLQAFAINDDTWQFKVMSPSAAPFAGFGVGTVGNAMFAPSNGFNGNIVDGLNFSIYTGDVSTSQLADKLLVKDTATFKFAGFSGFSLADISPSATFGFGTNPDAIVVVPEPGTIALVGAGVLAGMIGLVRRRTRFRATAVALTHSLWVSSLFVLIVIAILVFTPTASAGPIVVDDAFNFATGPLGWTATPVGKNGFLPPSTGGKQWTHTGNQWSVNWSPVDPRPDLYATGNYLTSPSINLSQQSIQAGGDGKVDGIRISLAHKYSFGSTNNGVPPAAGQVAISINGGAFVGLAASAFHTGSVLSSDPPFGASPLWPNYVGQTSLVAPTYVPPSGGYSDLFPLINGGAAFTGATPGYSDSGGTWVPTVATLSFTAQTITDLRIRLINANLGSSCPSDAGWDVRFVQVDAVAPEPGSLILAGMGCLLVSLRWVHRHSPFTSVPPSRA